ncbi:hypothetical protein [Flavivirga algicola]|uniref:DUF4145 domain-containing protein n=1 Tax=Flavivirga algicola TaxID=2729136 RepID=A0ABX1S254_9FLAO|nr:hypothetical protein [Flavivirga algicola]NMH89128.1 hypothetical protein [Flavivirga algicola]
MNNKDFFIKQLEYILSEYQTFENHCQYEDLSDKKNTVEMGVLISKSISTIERITSNKSEYYKLIQMAYDPKNARQYPHTGLILKHIIGIIEALKHDLENDYLKSLSEIIHSNLFSGYIDMATHLLEKGYKDPAAVLTGSTLENHLRNLCIKYDIQVEYENPKGKIVFKKADSMNIELAKKEVYNKTFQKQVTAWLDLRNNAAHGKYDQFREAEVKLMISGILNFIQLYSA